MKDEHQWEVGSVKMLHEWLLLRMVHQNINAWKCFGIGRQEERYRNEFFQCNVQVTWLKSSFSSTEQWSKHSSNQHDKYLKKVYSDRPQWLDLKPSPGMAATVVLWLALLPANIMPKYSCNKCFHTIWQNSHCSVFKNKMCTSTFLSNLQS